MLVTVGVVLAFMLRNTHKKVPVPVLFNLDVPVVVFVGEVDTAIYPAPSWIFAPRFTHKLKGNRQYVTLGFGLVYNVFTIDMAYLIPASPTTRSPLENTLRFSMAFNIDGFLEQ